MGASKKNTGKNGISMGSRRIPILQPPWESLKCVTGFFRVNYMEAGADAIFPEARNTAEMFREFAARTPGVPLLANMTEFGRTPFFTAAEFEAMGYKMVIWPVSSLRVANKPQEWLYATIRRDGATKAMVGDMQTRAELYETIDLTGYEALDASIVAMVLLV
jgi:methylisocitrate lyase